MIYGDNPVETESGLLMPNIHAIVQSSNLYVYCMNDPIKYIDPTGTSIWDTIKGFFDGVLSSVTNGSYSINDPAPRNVQPVNTQHLPIGNSGINETDRPTDYSAAHWLGNQYSSLVSNSDVAFDVSVSAGIPGTIFSGTVGYSYLMGNASNYTSGYLHISPGKSVGIMPFSGSIALGIVEHAPTPEAYSGSFIDISGTIGIGTEYCFWPKGASATSIVLSTEVAGGGIRYDKYILVHSTVNGANYYDLYQKQ